MVKKCRLCGGKLIQNRCEFCGLDNSVYDREEEKIYRRQREMEQAAGAGTTYQKVSAGRKRRGGITVAIILFIILAALIPTLIQGGMAILDGIFDGSEDTYTDSGYDYDSYDYDYDPYEFVTRQIPDEGSSYETLIGCGVYQIGVHIPEGIYRIELWDGSGSVQVDDYENIIYDYESFGEDEEYGEVKEKDDVRLYSGAQLMVGEGVVIQLTTSNAQPLVREITENPVQETAVLEEGRYTAGEDFPEGMYDICLADREEMFVYVTVTYPNESTDYFYPQYHMHEAGGGEYEENGVRNVILPSGTQIEVEDGGIFLEPSMEYYEVDYDNYPAGY